MLRTLFAVGVVTLGLAACHGTGTPPDLMPDPMNPMSYRAAPATAPHTPCSRAPAADRACLNTR